MHTEHFFVPVETLKVLKANIGNIVAVGTTSVRTLESLYWLGIRLLNKGNKNGEFHLNQWEAYDMQNNISAEVAIEQIIAYCENLGLSHFDGSTQIMISPGYHFQMVNALVTNFHQPRSTLLLLISAFIGEDWEKVYQHGRTSFSSFSTFFS